MLFATPVSVRQSVVDVRMYPHGMQPTEYQPSVVGVQFVLRESDPGRDWYSDALGPVGLVRGEPERFIVSMVGYGRDFVAEGVLNYSLPPDIPSQEPGITVAARDGGRDAQDRAAYGLWSAGLKNPLVM
jgi:hypothetical protein